ncbi:CGNR zinc finger protein [Kribbella amoyensis]|uniref:CGNR zinc finger protein n=1 Tax=Kribbella amoyensis TaxID=996641 RepID=A0A561B349_9ACTN|nr:ABATE domain-containing protein [Kribbella amoyensis]TWD73285.1 CGNR zinc finger protein [Kribbella amoyensis]
MAAVAFEVAATIRHDGRGGVLDELESATGVATWIERNAAGVAEVIGQPFAPGSVDPEEIGPRVREVRRAVRSLFARAVSPAPPSRADATRLLDPAIAVARLNKAAAVLGSRRLDWPDDGEPVVRWAGSGKPAADLLLGAIGRSAIDFLTGPDRARLRACPAARCVKYFLQEDPRQTWCSPTCGNRERVNRHYHRNRT